jgi:methionine synthase II (cobalamin-independent)
MPQTDPDEACSLVLAHLAEIPPWPQLPKRSFLENMYVQYSEGFPGVVVKGEHLYVDRSQDLDEDLTKLYVAYLEDKVEQYALRPDYAAGLHAFLSKDLGSPVAVKGQVAGPISWGLTVTDQDRRPVLYDDVLADALAKHLRLKAAWQERVLSRLSPSTIIFVDEPYMSSFGSAFVSLSRQQVVALLEEVFKGIRGLKGVHCCGNTDWSVLLETSVDILSLDAYNYGWSISLYPAEVKDFIQRGGIIAWGIVPADEDALAKESADSLIQRLEEAVSTLSKKGIDSDLLLERCLITPSCGLGSLSPETAIKALQLTGEVSRQLRSKYAQEVTAL